ncbi:MAG: DNA-binding response OmpR family regulator [Chlamydiales bacterium]|jgi:DNA-binding response OmpR family regulator
MGTERKILVMDPSGVIRQKIAEVARSMGHKALLSVDGEDGYNKLSSDGHEVGLIFTEWFLPKTSGLDLLVKLKNSDHKDIPVVFVTNESSKMSVVKALKSGASDYIVKPFSIEQIKQKIQHFIS